MCPFRNSPHIHIKTHGHQLLKILTTLARTLAATMANKNGSSSLHIVVFPWLAFGHMLPYLELSKSLASRGHRISFISTPRNIHRLPKPPPQLSQLITFIPFHLPKVDGLPELAEATSDLPTEAVEYLKVAFDALEHPFHEFIRQATPKPDWIINDFTHHWIPAVAADTGVPTIYLSIFLAGMHVFFGPTAERGRTSSRTTVEQYAVPPPWIPFPSKLCYRLHEARALFAQSVKPNVSGLSDVERSKIVIEGCTAVAVRSCAEVESKWLDLLPNILQKPILSVGLLPPSPLQGAGAEERSSIMDWLNKQKSKSVVYIAFGSEATLKIELLRELALGLELAKLPFLWAFKKPLGLPDHEGLLPDGFEERTKDYGLVARGWVPQLKILAHESMGGFLTHVGWSSVIESLQFGHPLVMLPIISDQGINARVVMEMGIAVEIERDEEDGWFTKEAVAAALRLAVDREKYRNRARELKQIVTDKPRQDKYVDDFVQFLRNHDNEVDKAGHK